MAVVFDYDTAFARNLGWLTRTEQRTLRGKCVAIAGLGGVGGLHLLTLVRLGVGRFHLAEFDTFDLVNFNRQVGASLSSVGRPKLEVMGAMARDINPTVEIADFPEGVNESNVDAFLAGADLFVDGLDFFAIAARELVFAECARRGITATTVDPLGMGAALLNFMPGKMGFAEYFGFDQSTEDEKPLRFLIGLAPAMLHRRYLVDPSFVDLASGRGPSTAMACQICAGVAATEALKILVGRGRVLARPGGYRHPMQRTLFALARRQFARMRSVAPR